MNKEQYKAIRNKRDFLYQYFIGNGGVDIGERQFTFLLGFWIQQSHNDVQKIMRDMVISIDKKFQ